MGDEHLWVTAPVEGSTNLETLRGLIIPEYIRNNIDKWGWGDAIAFESAETGRKYTHKEVLENSRVFAAGLLKLGSELNLQRSDVVAVILPNVPEYAAITFGIWEAGFISTPMNPSSTEYEFNRQSEAANAKVIITIPQLLSVTKKIQQKRGIKRIIILGDDPKDIFEDCLNYFEMLKEDINGIDFFKGSQLTRENDVALVPFSSGTSGLPKGVMLTHFGLLSNAVSFTHPKTTPVKNFENGNPQEKLIAVIPFFHVFGFTCTITVSMLQGIHVTTILAFNPNIFIRTLRQFKPTLLYLVPTLVSFICNSESIGSSELESVRHVYCGSVSAGEVLIKQFQEKAKRTKFLEGYGMTEMSPILAMARVQKTGSIGQPLPDIVLKIVDTITGVTLGQGERGELCVKSPSVMKGYLNNDAATREVIDDSGWFHSGDIGYYDEEGCFFIVDRLKELIKVKGFQVAPAELEDVIRSHEKVADVGVIGIPDEICGEVPRAFVVPKPGQALTEPAIVNFVRDRVSSYKYLKGGVQLVEIIPRGGTGKILRRVLREKYGIPTQ